MFDSLHLEYPRHKKLTSLFKKKSHEENVSFFHLKKHLYETDKNQYRKPQAINTQRTSDDVVPSPH